MKNAWILLTTVCVVVVGVYAYMVKSSGLELKGPDAADAYYNLLVEGFRAGQLNLRREVPPEFARLADPYDPVAHLRYQGSPYRMVDLSYYKGKLYLYFGVAPALILFWPYVALTGHYLLHKWAVMIFCALGFLASVDLLRALWRRYFADVSVWVVAACALALGLTTGVPLLLWRSDVYEVAISCGYLMTMLALGAIWRALHEPRMRSTWLAVGSVAYGLAVGARPSLLFGGIILLVPVVQEWRERRQVGTTLLAATGPIVLIGLGLMLYNFRRFDNPFEFGMHYQLNDVPLITRKFFSLQYLWFNFRIFFLEPARWSAHFPFVHNITAPHLPAGYAQFRDPFGVLTNIPLVWVALAAPLAWRNRSEEAGTILRWFTATVALLFGTCALTIALYVSASFRYEVEFLPALVWLAVIGILGVERTLGPTLESGQLDRPACRWAARCGWCLLLVFSVAFNLLAAVDHYFEGHCDLGLEFVNVGRFSEGIEQFKEALWLRPDSAELEGNLGGALLQAGKFEEAIRHDERALRLMNDSDMTRFGFAACYNLGNALREVGRQSDAAQQYERAIRIRPDFVKAHISLGVEYERLGCRQEAIAQYEQVLQMDPTDASSLQFLAGAENNLAWSLATIPATEGGDPVRAVILAEHACDLNGHKTSAYLDTLSVAYAAAGRFNDAIPTGEKALELARAANDSKLAQEIAARLELYRSGQPYRLPAPQPIMTLVPPIQTPTTPESGQRDRR